MRDFLLSAALILFALAVLSGGAMLAWTATGRGGDRLRKMQARSMSPVEEIFHPLVHDANIVWEAQVEMVTPIPAAGDKPLLGNSIVIDSVPDVAPAMEQQTTALRGSQTLARSPRQTSDHRRRSESR